MHGSKRCVKLCVAEGIDPNIYNSKGKTGLHLAIESNALGRDDTGKNDKTWKSIFFKKKSRRKAGYPITPLLNFTPITTTRPI